MSVSLVQIAEAAEAGLDEITLCYNCGKNPANDCGNLVYDDYCGEWDCDDPDDKIECPCELTHCDECRKEIKNESVSTGESD